MTIGTELAFYPFFAPCFPGLRLTLERTSARWRLKARLEGDCFSERRALEEKDREETASKTTFLDERTTRGQNAVLVTTSESKSSIKESSGNCFHEGGLP